MAALLWLVGALVLAGAEALAGDFFLLMLAGGALATAGVSSVTDFPVWVDAIMFGVFSGVLILGVRPFLLRRFGTPPPTPMGIQALEGKHAVVLEEVGEHAGQVKLDGQIWTARPLDSADVYPAGTTVTVMEINGATAVVWRGP
ncbi:NfeD family protein [Rhodococcus sp. 24CO]|uniref:NfeD family protein n=1 Tax=Rhodococcus sp. 24CO TaxID=3117460 RepID=UPI003D33A60E